MLGRSRKPPAPENPTFINRHLDGLLAGLDPAQNPNINALRLALRDIDALKLNLKFFGYEIARLLREAAPPREVAEPQPLSLACKPATQADIESDWVAHWASQLKIGVVYHRKLWELTYVLQALHSFGHVHDGARGLGFGCGEEPIPSFLASRGAIITVTDLAPDDARAADWINSAQHANGRDKVYLPHLVERATFERNVDFRHVDMNAIPDTLTGYDFCWSICALEHLGSIRQGLDFIANAMRTLRPGGLAVHTTEFNCLNDNETIDNWPTVLFQRKHFEEIAARLREAGHIVSNLDFSLGDKVLDRFIDLPPYPHDMSQPMREMWGTGGAHLKLNIDGFVSTCFGLIVQKAG